MKLKLMIALVIMALVFGMTFTACDDGDAPDIKYTYKEVSGTSVKTDTIYDATLLGATYDENPKKADGTANPDFGKYTPPGGDTTEVGKTPNDPSDLSKGYHWEVPGWPSL